MKQVKQNLLQIAHTTWQKHWESLDFTQTYQVGQVQGSKSLYQIGKELRLVRSCMPVSTDNAATGVFPCVQPLSEPMVWRAVQLKRMQEAVEQGQWQSQFESLTQQADELDQP
jgi:hypothetical protein